MGIRRKSREMALKAIFEIDFADTKSEEIFERLKTEHESEEEALLFMKDLLDHYGAHSGEVNKLIEEHSSHWKLSRMASVDRNILRLGVVEILYMADIPKNVTINEYLEIAKKYGTEESSSFINGILDKITT